MKKEAGAGDVPRADARPPVTPDSRPPEQTESGTRHIFLVQDGEYRCSRCGAPMDDRTLTEECPAAR